MPRWNRVLLAIMLFAVVPALIASLTTRALWGYWFSPPPIESLLIPLYHIDSVGYYALDVEGDGSYKAFNADVNYTMYWHEDIYTRPERAAISRGINRITPLDDATLAEIAALLQRTDWRIFVDGIDWTAVQQTAHPLIRAHHVGFSTREFGLPQGYVIRGRGANNEPLVFVSITSMNAVDGNDDHYYYYEALFQEGNGLVMRDWQTFQYGIAGIEFVTWQFVFVATLLLISLPTWLIARSLPVKRKRSPAYA